MAQQHVDNDKLDNDKLNNQVSGEIAASTSVEVSQNLVSGTIYMMGTSFILGVLFTVLVLLLLDFMRRNTEEKK